MIAFMIIVFILYLVEGIWCPRLDWIDKENMLLLHYSSKKHTREYLVVVRF
jgi:hypothetical protein